MRFLSLLICLISYPAFSLELSLEPAIRTYPVSTSAEATLAEETVFWGEDNIQNPEKFYQFGYIRQKLAIAAHGKAEASFQFAPISILEFSASYSRTSRFYETKPFDCSQYFCKGNVDRTAVGVRLALAAAGFQGLLAHSESKISNGDDSKRMIDESEVLWTNPGFDTLRSSSVYISKTGTPFGVFARKARYLRAQVGNEAAYFVLRHKMEDVSYALGVGRYASDFSVPELSVYASVIWNFTINGKKSVALF